jgi:hypothetical protein
VRVRRRDVHAPRAAGDHVEAHPHGQGGTCSLLSCLYCT